MATHGSGIASDGNGQLALSVQDQDLASVASIGLGNLLVGLHSIGDAVAFQSGGSALHAGPVHGGSGASGVYSQTLHVVASAQLGVIGDEVHGAAVDANGITILHLLRGNGGEIARVLNDVHTLQSAVRNHGQGQSTGLDLTSVDVLQTGLQVGNILDQARALVANGALQSGHVGGSTEVAGGMTANSSSIASDVKGELAVGSSLSDLVGSASTASVGQVGGLHSISDAVAVDSSGLTSDAGPCDLGGLIGQGHVGDLGVGCGDQVHSAVLDLDDVANVDVPLGQSILSALVFNLNALAADIGGQVGAVDHALDRRSVDAGDARAVLQTGDHGAVQSSHTVDQLLDQVAHGIGGIQVGADGKGSSTSALNLVVLAKSNDVRGSTEEHGIPVHTIVATNGSLQSSSH